MIVTCTHCNKDKEHKARGLCQACYQRDYRQRNPTPSQSEIRQSAYEHIALLVNDILKDLGGACYVVDDKVVLETGRKKHVRHLTL